eukprot:TRINITY_DN2829_c0_g1_i1.p1 TRINITY_DN2829_c0_g1~~TRINITY_DN2829_c0_g1_i1.p1  ORF type:complete len:962 (-),score=261.72 TRINITY_DN2829_c0_g1_i1:75-2960(-)
MQERGERFPSPASPRNASPGVLSGWLQKKGEKGFLRSYKKRFFLQAGEKLYYFQAKGDAQSLGHIYLPDVLSVRDTTQITTGVRKDASCTFDVITAKRVYELLAPTEKDALFWINGLNEIIRAQNHERRLSSPYPSQALTAAGSTDTSRSTHAHRHSSISTIVTSATAPTGQTMDPRHLLSVSLPAADPFFHHRFLGGSGGSGGSRGVARGSVTGTSIGAGMDLEKEDALSKAQLVSSVQKVHWKEVRAAMERDIHKLRARVARLKAERSDAIAKAEEEVKNRDSTILMLQSEKSHLDARVAEASQQFDEVNARAESAQKRVADLSAGLERRTAELREANEKLEALQFQERERTEAREAAHLLALSELQDELSSTKDEVASARRRIGQLEDEVQRTQSEKNELRQDNAKAMDQLRDYISGPNTSDPTTEQSTTTTTAAALITSPRDESGMLALLLDKDDKLQKKEDEVAELRRQIESYRSQDGERLALEAELARVRQERELLGNKHADTVDRLTTQLEETQIKLKKRADRKARLVRQHSEVERTMQTLTADAERRERALEANRLLLRKSEEREKTLIKKNQEWQHASTEVQEINAALYKELDAKDTQIHDLELAVKELQLTQQLHQQSRLKRQQQQQQQQQAEQKAISELVCVDPKVYQQELSALTSALDAKTSENEKLKIALLEQEKRVRRLRASAEGSDVERSDSISEMKLNMLSLQQSLSNNQIDLVDAQQRIAELEEHTTRQRAAFDAHRRDLESQLTDTREALLIAKERADNAEAQLLRAVASEDSEHATTDDDETEKIVGNETRTRSGHLALSNSNNSGGNGILNTILLSTSTSSLSCTNGGGDDGPSPKVPRKVWEAEKRELQAELARVQLTLEQVQVASENGAKALQRFIDEMQRDLFYSLAVGIKINLLTRGVPCTQDIMSLYERCVLGERVPHKDWNEWIHRQLDKTTFKS